MSDETKYIHAAEQAVRLHAEQVGDLPCPDDGIDDDHVAGLLADILKLADDRGWHFASLMAKAIQMNREN